MRFALGLDRWRWRLGGLVGKAWAGELIRTNLRDVNDLLAQGALG